MSDISGSMQFFILFSNMALERRRKNVESVLIVENTRIRTEKSKDEAIFVDYEHEEIVLRQNAYDIRNQHRKQHPITWIESKGIFYYSWPPHFSLMLLSFNFVYSPSVEIL